MFQSIFLDHVRVFGFLQDRIVKQYNDDQLMELCDLMKGPKYSVISSETRQSVYEKICKAFKAAKRNIALLEKRLA